MLRWYLIHTKASSETVAKSNLERQGYEVYLPRVIQPVRYRGRWQDRINPLFPRYLFMQLDEGHQPLSPVRSTVGVASIVRFGSSPAVVPDAVILKLRERADPQSGLHRLNDLRLPSPGDSVRVAAGPFSGLEGIFQRRAGADRVVVLLNVLGQAAPVRVAYDFLLPAQAS